MNALGRTHEEDRCHGASENVMDADVEGLEEKTQAPDLGQCGKEDRRRTKAGNKAEATGTLESAPTAASGLDPNQRLPHGLYPERRKAKRYNQCRIAKTSNHFFLNSP